MSRNLVEKTTCGDFATGYCAATESIKNSFFSFLKNVITVVIHCRFLDELLNQSFNRCSRSDSFMQVLVKNVVNDPNFITPVAAFVCKRVINALKEELKQALKVTKKIFSLPDHSSSVFTEAWFDGESKARRYAHKRRNCKVQKYRDSLTESREKDRRDCGSRSSFDADSNFMTPKTKTSGSSSRFCLKSSLSSINEDATLVVAKTAKGSLPCEPPLQNGSRLSYLLLSGYIEKVRSVGIEV